MTWFNPSGPKTGNGYGSIPGSDRVRIRPIFRRSDGSMTRKPANSVRQTPEPKVKSSGHFETHRGFSVWVEDE